MTSRQDATWLSRPGKEDNLKNQTWTTLLRSRKEKLPAGRTGASQPTEKIGGGGEIMQRRAFRFSLLALAAISVALAATPVLAQWHLATTFENQSDGQANDSFGSAVAIQGDTLVVTAPSHNQVGAAYVFTEDSNGFWSTVAELTPSDGVAPSRFGTSVAINGNTIVVGNSGCFGCSGAAYVYVEPVAGWTNMTETAKLTGSDEASSDLFGGSVAVSGNAIAVGAPSHQSGSRIGAVYMYVRPAAGWTSMTETTELTVSDSNARDVGHAVALQGPTLVVGALTSTVNSVSQAGAVYIFVRPLSGWTPENESATLTASDPTASAWLGGAVAISSDQKTIVAGAPFWHFASVPNGAAYIFVRPSVSWQSETQTAKLLPPGTARLFGSAVATNTGNVVAIGAPDTAITGFTSAGAAWVYIRPTTGWAPTPKPKARLNPPPPQTQGVFGASIAVRLTDVLVGEPGATVNGNASQGAAYLFSK
jgi:FG-GAP repeat